MSVSHILLAWVALNAGLVGIPFTRALLAMARESAARQFWIKTHPGMAIARMPVGVSGASPVISQSVSL